MHTHLNLRNFMGLALMLMLATGAYGAGASEWRQYENPASAGWSVEKLEKARGIASEAGSAAVMVVEGGTVVAAWGDVDRSFPIHSMRKGIYNALVGMLMEDGKIDLDATLGELGIDDVEGLTEQERGATVRDVLASRSGVYHISAYEPASMKRNRPERGSAVPGETWFYNNWDFNLVAHLIERASGSELSEVFMSRLAAPLGMEDLSKDSIFSFREPSRSRYPAVIFRMSARDLARFGVLFEQMGRWEGDELIDEAWIDASWEPSTQFAEPPSWEDATAFGYMWWIHGARAEAERDFARHDIFLTRGSDGQVVAIVPSLDLVVVHLTDSELATGGSFEGAARVIDAVIAAKKGSADGLRLTSLRAVPFENAGPEPERRAAVPWSEEDFQDLIGDYALNPQVSFHIHEVDGRLFALPKGAPLAEVELFMDESGVLFSPVLPVELRPIRSDDGRVVALEGEVEGRRVRLERSER